MKILLPLLFLGSFSEAVALPPLPSGTLSRPAQARVARPMAVPLPMERVLRMVPRKAASANRFDRKISRYARLFRIDPRLMKSIVAVESSFRPKSVSKAGALGLMQVMPATARGFGYEPRSLTTVDGGLKAGAHQLAWLYKYMYDRLLGIRRKGWIDSTQAPRWIHEKVVLAYFAGQNNVRKNNITPASRHYLNKVMSLYDSASPLQSPAKEPLWLSP